MEIEIKLKMNVDKSIGVFYDNEQKHNISEAKREVTAKEIYDIFNYKTGNSYKIIVENQEEIDKKGQYLYLPHSSRFNNILWSKFRKFNELNQELFSQFQNLIYNFFNF